MVVRESTWDVVLKEDVGMSIVDGLDGELKELKGVLGERG